jgi:hypothetical protein
MRRLRELVPEAARGAVDLPAERVEQQDRLEARGATPEMVAQAAPQVDSRGPPGVVAIANTSVTITESWK